MVGLYQWNYTIHNCRATRIPIEGRTYMPTECKCCVSVDYWIRDIESKARQPLGAHAPPHGETLRNCAR